MTEKQLRTKSQNRKENSISIHTELKRKIVVDVGKILQCLQSCYYRTQKNGVSIQLQSQY